MYRRNGKEQALKSAVMVVLGAAEYSDSQKNTYLSELLRIAQNEDIEATYDQALVEGIFRKESNG